MFDQSLYTITAAEKQRAAVAGVIQSAIADETFTYTELLSSNEPLRTHALEFLDGIKVNGKFPQPGGQPIVWETIPWTINGKFRLVSIKPIGTEQRRLANGQLIEVPVGFIQHTIDKPVRVPGTHNVRMDRMLENFGNICDMTDHPGPRLARNILHKEGWPGKQLRNPNGSLSGTVVELRWLEFEVARAQPVHGSVELYEQLLPRVRAWEADQAKKADEAREAARTAAAQKTKNQNPKAA